MAGGNEREDPIVAILLILSVVLLILFGILYAINASTLYANFIKDVIILDLKFFTLFDFFYPKEEIEAMKRYFGQGNMETVGYSVGKGFLLWNVGRNGGTYRVLEDFSQRFYYFNAFVSFIFLLPFMFGLHKLYLKKGKRDNLVAKRETAYAIIPEGERPEFKASSGTKLLNVDYVVPNILNKNSYLVDSIRISLKVLDLDKMEQKFNLAKAEVEEIIYHNVNEQKEIIRKKKESGKKLVAEIKSIESGELNSEEQESKIAKLKADTMKELEEKEARSKTILDDIDNIRGKYSHIELYKDNINNAVFSSIKKLISGTKDKAKKEQHIKNLKKIEANQDGRLYITYAGQAIRYLRKLKTKDEVLISHVRSDIEMKEKIIDLNELLEKNSLAIVENYSLNKRLAQGKGEGILIVSIKEKIKALSINISSLVAEVEKEEKRASYDMLKANFLDNETLLEYRVGNKEDFKDYLLYKRFYQKPPLQDFKIEEPPSLPKIMTKENRKTIINSLKKRMYRMPEVSDSRREKQGQFIIPPASILTPIDLSGDRSIHDFSCLGAQEFVIPILSRYIIDDFEEESKSEIKKLKQDIKTLEKEGQRGLDVSQGILESEGAITRLESLLSEDGKDSTMRKMIELAQTHKFEETYLVAMWEFGQTLVNLPTGPISRLSKLNPPLWFSLTSIGRPYVFRPGEVVFTMYHIEKDVYNSETRKIKEKIEALVDKNGDDFMNPTVAEKQDKYQSRRKRHA